MYTLKVTYYVIVFRIGNKYFDSSFDSARHQSSLKRDEKS